MIQQEGRTEVLVVCDECGTESETYGRDQFLEMISEIKRLGWTVKKETDGTWSHNCPDPECCPSDDEDDDDDAWD